MRRLWIVIIAIIVLVPILLAAGLMLVPQSVYRDKITTAVKSATGRDLKIVGNIGVSLLPRLGVSAKDVTLSNPAGFSSSPFASMTSLEAGVALWPLIGGKIEIARFVLVDPKIALEVDQAGNNNWTFQSKKPAEADKEPTPDQKKKAGGINDLSLGELQLQNGAVSYVNHQSGENWRLDAINIEVTLPSLDEPSNLNGSAMWKGKKVNLTLDTKNPRAIITGAGAPLNLKVDSELLKANFDGTAAAGAKAKLNGKADLNVTSVRELSAWLAKPMAPSQGFGPLVISGVLAMEGNRIDFSDATVQFDKIDGKGRIAVKTGGDRPNVTADLAVGTLDVTPYMGKDAAPAGGDQAGGPAPAPAGGGGWSTEPIDLKVLKTVDGDFSFQAKKIQAKKLTFTDSDLSVTLREGIMFATLSKLSLYGGSGKAKLIVDGAAGTPQLTADMAFTGIAIEPFLRDGANFEKLSGTGNLTMNVKSGGSSQRALANNLNGSGALKLANGAIKGINLAAMVRNITGAFSGGDSGPQQTDFAALGGTWTINSGILTNNDMEMLNPLIRVTGAGTADIGNRTVDYRITPKAVSSLEGQGGRTDVTGLSVPVKVTGSWDHLTFAPDPKGLLEGALKGLSEAQGAGQDPLKGALKGLLGQPGAKPATAPPPQQGGAAPAPAPATKEKPAEKLLKGLLGGGQ